MVRRVAAVLICALTTFVSGMPRAYAWIENHVVAAESRLELDRHGKAVVEHRITLRTNGNERLRVWRVSDVDRDASPQPNGYAVPAADALSSSLESAVPLELELVYPEKKRGEQTDPPAELVIRIGDPKGLRRGTYLMVLRYQTDLQARDLVSRDGAMLRVAWHGPRFEQGFDNARMLFVVPAAPTPPHAIESGASEEDGDAIKLAPTYFSEVRRGTEQDEVELLRTYAPSGESVPWIIRIDPRAMTPLLVENEEAPLPPPEQPRGPLAHERPVVLGAALALFFGYLLLVWLKTREVARSARQRRATMPPLLPLPPALRALGAAAALTSGVALELSMLGPPSAFWCGPGAGAVLVVLACALAAHGAARIDPKATKRGPGRWLTVSESEGLGAVPPPRGVYFDLSAWPARALLVAIVVAVVALARLMWPHSRAHALLIGFDIVAILAVLGTGRASALPPDLAVEPARFLRKLARRLRTMRGAEELRLSPRLRIPNGQLDADELRLCIVPRVPLRGFGSIEVGLSYALGVGARVGMPEVLLRVTEGSPCDEAVLAISRRGRVTPGRKPDERVIALSPRLPTVNMTADIAAALAAKVMDKSASRTLSNKDVRPRIGDAAKAA